MSPDFRDNFVPSRTFPFAKRYWEKVSGAVWYKSQDYLSPNMINVVVSLLLEASVWAGHTHTNRPTSRGMVPSTLAGTALVPTLQLTYNRVYSA